MVNSICKGDYFIIRNTTISGKPINEGIAKIVKIIKIEPEFNQARCEVQFYGENESYERFVNLDDKTDINVKW